MKKNTIESISTDELEKILAERKAAARAAVQAKNIALVEAAQEAARANMPFQMTGNALPFSPADFMYPDVAVTPTTTKATRQTGKVYTAVVDGKTITATTVKAFALALGWHGEHDPKTYIKNTLGGREQAIAAGITDSGNW